jgi:epsilon-lactone hydrolase
LESVEGKRSLSAHVPAKGGEDRLSSVVTSHTTLVRLGVEAQLHIWEGMGHATYAFNPKAPESDEVHQVIVDFFDKHLGR